MIKPYNILRNILLLTLTAVSLLFVFSAMAMAANIDIPTATLKKGTFSIGAELNISGRDVEFSDKTVNENTHVYLAKVGYGLWDRVNLFGTVGAGSIHDGTGFDGDTGLAYGGGFKLQLYQYEDVFILGLTGEYLRFTSQADNVSGVNGLSLKSTWNEYDFGLGASSTIAGSTFYGGGLLSFVDGELKTTFPTGGQQNAHYKQSHPAGIFLGGDTVLFIDQIHFGFEARLFDETSFSVKLSYAFAGPKQVVEKK